jgi:hypothetical protein
MTGLAACSPEHSICAKPCSRQLTLKFRMARDTSEPAIWTIPMFTVRFGR